MREPLQLERIVTGDVTTAQVAGELDCHTAPALSELVEDSLRRDPRLLLLDLTMCTFMDSAGCRVLAVAHRLAGDGRIGVVCPESNRAVRRVLEIVGLVEALDVQARLADFDRPALDRPA